MRTKLSTLLFTVLNSAITYGNEELGNPPYQISFIESFTPSVNVSGQLLVGIQVPTESQVSLGNTLYINKPKHINEFQLRISTIDGVYSARTPITFSAAISGWYPIYLQSKHQEKLKNYSPHEIQAYLYKIIKNEKSRKSTHLIFQTSWGLPSSENPKFYINSSGQVPQYVFKVEGKTNRVLCEEVASEVRTSFTHECSWDEQLVSGENLVLFKSGNGRNKSYLVWRQPDE